MNLNYENNVDILHYYINEVIERKGLAGPRCEKFIDAAYEIRGAMLDGLEQSDLPALISDIRSDKQYWGLDAERSVLQEMMTGGASN